MIMRGVMARLQLVVVFVSSSGVQVVGQVSFIRWIEAFPLWEEPLSTTQNTRRA